MFENSPRPVFAVRHPPQGVPRSVPFGTSGTFGTADDGRGSTAKIIEFKRNNMKTNIFYIAVSGMFAGFIIAPSAYSRNLQHSYEDSPYLQDFAEKIPLSEELAGTELSAVSSDRNGRILVLSSKGLLQIHNGKLVPDNHYRPMLDMKIRSIDAYRDQFVYLTDKVVLSNAWAGQFYVSHKMPDAGLFEMGSNFDFLSYL